MIPGQSAGLPADRKRGTAVTKPKEKPETETVSTHRPTRVRTERSRIFTLRDHRCEPASETRSDASEQPPPAETGPQRTSPTRCVNPRTSRRVRADIGRAVARHCRCHGPGRDDPDVQAEVDRVGLRCGPRTRLLGAGVHGKSSSSQGIPHGRGADDLTRHSSTSRGFRACADRPYGDAWRPYGLYDSSMTALGNRPRQSGSWRLVGFPGG